MKVNLNAVKCKQEFKDVRMVVFTCWHRLWYIKQGLWQLVGVCVCIYIPCCWNMSMVWGEVWTGSEWVRCTELRLWLGMLLLPPGLANHRFYILENTSSLYTNFTYPGKMGKLLKSSAKSSNKNAHSIKHWSRTSFTASVHWLNLHFFAFRIKGALRLF